MTRRIDLNSDMGEGFGAWAMGDDEAMLGIVTSANVACGFHAGDPSIMVRTARLARAKGVALGAHPSFRDLAGFGRREIRGIGAAEAEALVAYQIGALQGAAALAGHRVAHVKAHGALYNMAAADPALARAIARAVKAVDPDLVFVAPPGSELARAGEDGGLAVALEVFADRAYLPDGRLVPRDRPGAVIHDAQAAAARVLGMVRDGAVTAIDGSRLPLRIDTICVHGDTPAAVAMAAAVRAALEADGIALAPLAAA